MLCRRHESAEKSWQLIAACQPHREPNGQRQAMDHAASIGRVGTVRLSSFEVADPAARIRMIGSAAAKRGADFAHDHAAELRWLADQGVSVAEAQRRNDEWVQAELKDEFWDPAAPPSKPRRRA